MLTYIEVLDMNVMSMLTYVEVLDMNVMSVITYVEVFLEGERLLHGAVAVVEGVLPGVE